MKIISKIIRNSKDEIWTSFAKEIGATYVKEGLLIRTDSRLIYKYKIWEIILDNEYDDEYRTRARVLFYNPNNFKFFLHPSNKIYLSDFVTFNNIKTGDIKFDERFILKGNERKKVNDIFNNKEIWKLLLSLPKGYLKVMQSETILSQRFPRGISLLKYSNNGICKDKDDLLSIIELFKLLLDIFVNLQITQLMFPNIEIKSYYSYVEILTNFRNNLIKK